MKKLFTCLLFVSILLIQQSCEDSYNICDQPRGVFVKGQFYKLVGGVATLAPAASLTMRNINSSVYDYNQKNNISEFAVLLSPVEDTFHYYIRLSDNAVADTLSFIYSTQKMNISAECGTIDIYYLNKIYSTTNSIDSVRLINPEVTNTSAQNLNIYY